jgi:hypothetical protein
MFDYIEYGLRTSSPGPFQCSRCEMRGYVLRGDEDRIKALIKRVLNDVAPKEIDYTPEFGPWVVLMMGSNLVSALPAPKGSPAPPDGGPPWSDRGTVDETLASFWIPLVKTRNGSKTDRKLRMFISHILVNNPVSLYTGREVYGFAKALGRFSPENGLNQPSGRLGPIRVEAFGGNFNPGRIVWHPLLDLTPVRQRPVVKGTITHVFLKQFRDAADQTKACYREVIESESKVIDYDPWRLGKNFRQAWHVEIHPLDYHPITDELGVSSQTTELTYEVSFAFDVLPGAEVTA